MKIRSKILITIIIALIHNQVAIAAGSDTAVLEKILEITKIGFDNVTSKQISTENSLNSIFIKAPNSKGSGFFKA